MCLLAVDQPLFLVQIALQLVVRALAISSAVRDVPVPQLFLHGGNSAALIHQIPDVMPESMRVDAIDLGTVSDLLDDV